MATPTLQQELIDRGFNNVKLWSRGVDAKLFHPQDVDLGFKRPVFLSVGRLAVEKNLESFLVLELLLATLLRKRRATGASRMQ